MNQDYEEFLSASASKEVQRHVPDRIHRLAHYYHNYVQIWEFYRSLGHDLDPVLKEEMQRAHDELREAIIEEKSQGGMLHGKAVKPKGPHA
jgi:hypothetical protein